MYPTTNDYKLAIAKNARAHRLTGTVAGTAFDGGDVIGKSFVVKNQLCPATNIQLGGVYVGEMDLVFNKAFAESLGIRGTWHGQTITASIGVELEDSTFETIPVPGGTYTIESATWTDKGLSVVAYDNMSKLDAPLPMEQAEGTAYDFLTFIGTRCGVTIGNTAQEIAALPNGDQIISLYAASPVETFRDMLSQLATLCCCFVTINRSGALVLIPFPDTATVTDSIPSKLRYSTTFSDYTSFYTALEVADDVDGIVYEYFNDNLGGLALDIGSNAFLQYGVASVKASRSQAIIDALEPFRAVPFKVSIMPNPAYDLGDVIEFPGGYGSGAVGMIMSFVLKVDSMTLEGYGENPAASGVTSTMQKEITNNARNSKEQGMTYYPYINTRSITLTSTPQRLYKIVFATADQTNVELWHEIKWNISDGPAEITYEYYLDGVKFDHEPVDTWADGYHSMPHPWWLLDVEGGVTHYWEVRASVSGGSASVAIGDIHALLKGQKLVGSVKFDGNIEVSDEFEPLIGGQDIVGLSDTVVSIETDLLYPNIIKSDSFTAFTGGQQIVGLSDSARLRTAYEIHTRITEDGDVRITMDGDTRTTEGGYQ